MGCGPASRDKRRTMSPVRILALLLLVLLASPLLLAGLPAPGAAQEGGAERLALTLDDAIRLALRNNRGLLDAQLQRTIRAFSLEVAEDRYRPTASIGSSARAGKEQDWTTDVVAETGLRVRTGGQVSLRWSKPLAAGTTPPAASPSASRSRCCGASGWASRPRRSGWRGSARR